MIFKKIDSKNNAIETLESLYKKSTSEKQKQLIYTDLKTLKNGMEAEKENAYYIDFYLENNSNLIVLHDLRIEYKGQSAQIDHMLISRFGIELLESKSFTGIVTINDDNSITVDYNGKFKSFPNPLEQGKRHAKLLKKLLEDNLDIGKRINILGGIDIETVVLINPKTTIKNTILPKGFFRADSYISKRNDEIDKIGIFSAFKLASKMMTIAEAKEIANYLITVHKPVKFNYANKYKIANIPLEKKNTSPIEVPIKTTNAVNEKLTVGSPCPFCQKPLVLRNVNKPTPFLGCSSYPDCRFTRRISKNDINEILKKQNRC